MFRLLNPEETEIVFPLKTYNEVFFNNNAINPQVCFPICNFVKVIFAAESSRCKVEVSLWLTLGDIKFRKLSNLKTSCPTTKGEQKHSDKERITYIW